MAILFVASEAFELKPLAERLTGLRSLKWPLDYAEEGVWHGKRYLLTANGAGPRLASHCVEVASGPRRWRNCPLRSLRQL